MACAMLDADSGNVSTFSFLTKFRKHKMAKLPKYTLSHDERKNDWVLKEDGASRAKRRFKTKADATTGGILSSAVGAAGGSVKIQKMDGKYQEERTYPRSRDPKKSPG